MKLGVACILVFVFLLSVPARAASTGDPAVVLRVGYYDNPPKIFRNDMGEPDGFWPALVNELARSNGWRVSWEFGDWEALTARLADGTIDMLPDMAFTKARARRFTFNREVVLVSWSRVYVRSGIDAQTLPDLAGLRVAVLRDSVNYTGEDGIANLLGRFQTPVQFIELDSYEAVFAALAAGTADAGVTNKDFGARYEARYGVRRTPIIFSPASLHFAFAPGRPGNQRLVEDIDRALGSMKHNNMSPYYLMMDQYLGVHPSSQPRVPDWLMPAVAGGSVMLVLLLFGSLGLKMQMRRRNHALSSLMQDRQDAEALAEKNALQLKAFFENSPTAASITNTLGQLQMANEHFVALAGRSQERLVGKTLSDVLSPDDARMLDSHQQAVIRARRPLQFEERLHVGDEERLYLSTRFPLRDGRGQIFGLGAVSLDVTDQHITEHLLAIQVDVLEALSQQDASLEQVLQRLLDSASTHFAETGLVLVCHVDDAPLVVAAEGDLLVHGAPLAMTSLLQLVEPSAGHQVIDLLAGSVCPSLQQLARLNSTRYAQLLPLASTEGQQAALLACLCEAPLAEGSRRLRVLQGLAQMALLAIERYRYRHEQALALAMYAATSDALVVVDAAQRITRVNAAFMAMVGKPERALIGQPYLSVLGVALPDVQGGEPERALREILVPDASGQRVLLERIVPLQQGRDRHGHRIVVLTDISQIKQRQAEIEFVTQHDVLTGLPNRHRIAQLLDAVIDDSRTSKETFALAFINIDRFKEINDGLGHAVGDAVLREVAQRLRNLLRTDDYVARVGGDEFVAVLRKISDDDGLAGVRTKLMQRFDEPVCVGGREVYVGASIGFALYPEDGERPDELLRNADVAMYDAKAKGRNRTSRYDPALSAAASQRFELEVAMRAGLGRGEFSLVYQPQVDLATLRLSGLEALVRWRRPDHGPVSPGEFIPVAEASGLILELDGWVLDEACRQARAWCDAGVAFHRVSINLSAIDLGSSNIVDKVLGAIRRHGIDPAMLGIEVTESTLMDNVQSAFEQLSALREAGVFVSIDDFGTGYSSLSYLKRLQVNELKIDKSFIDDLPLEENDRAICETIIQMGRHLGLEVIAEGVETASQASFLQDQGCARAQGYWFARPQTPEELMKWMEEWLL